MPFGTIGYKELKNYKIPTRAANNITKERFPELIKDLWSRSLTPEHLISGFCAVGLAPFDPSAVKAGQLAPSLHMSATGSSGSVQEPFELHQ